MTEQFVTEPERRIPIVANVDVLVTGAGPAGVAAALAAARAGADTMLVEQFNCVGGMATSGMMSHFSGGTESPLLDELMDAMFAEPEGVFLADQKPNRWTIHHEALKNAMLKKLTEAGVKLKLYTFACDVLTEGNRVTGIVCESKTGRNAIRAKVVVDCTGDGDIAAKAGAEYTMGREVDGRCQPVTLMFRIAGVDYTRAILPPSFETTVQVPAGEIQKLGKSILPFPAGHVLLYPSWIPGEICVNMTNVLDIDGTDADSLTKAELVCRAQMSEIVPFLRKYAPGYEHCYVTASAQNVGVRETRHFKGLYTIQAEDIVMARVFDDWIATRNHFNFDIHNLDGNGLDKNGKQNEFRSNGKYTVPYGACVPVKVDGLLLAGRNISGTHLAHSNYRVMPICMNIGQGIGIAAAQAALNGIPPRAVNVKDVQTRLMEAGVRP